MRRILLLCLIGLVFSATPHATAKVRPSSTSIQKGAQYVGNLDLLPLSCISDVSEQLFFNLPPNIVALLKKWLPHSLAIEAQTNPHEQHPLESDLESLLIGNPTKIALKKSLKKLNDEGVEGFFIPRLLVYPSETLHYLKEKRCKHPLILLAFARRLDTDGLTHTALQEIEACSGMPQAARQLVKAQLLIDHGQLRSAESLLQKLQPTRTISSCHAASMEPAAYLGNRKTAFELRMHIELALRTKDLKNARRYLEEITRWMDRDPDAFALFVDLAMRLNDRPMIEALLDQLKKDPRLSVLRWALLDRIATIAPGPDALDLLEAKHTDLLTPPVGLNQAFRLALGSGETQRARAYRNRISTPPKELDQRLAYQEGQTQKKYAAPPPKLFSDAILDAAESRLGIGTILLEERIDITVDDQRRKRIRHRWVFGRSAKSEGGDSPQVRIYTDPGREILNVGEVYIRCGKRSGTLLAEEDFQDLAEEDLRIYYNLREHRFQFPELPPGCVASLDVITEELEALPFDGYFGQEENLDRGWPTRRFQLSYSLPKGLKLHSRVIPATQQERRPQMNGESILNARGGLDFHYILHDLKPQKDDLYLPGGSDTNAALLVSTFSSPAALAEWYHQWGIGPPKPVTTATLEEVFGESIPAEPMEQLRAAFRFVSQEIRYVGLEFGVHSYQPYSVQTVLKRRFGDCKDKARLMRDLLHSIGIKSHMVLVRPRNYGRLPLIRPPLPLPLDSFYHASLAVELPNTAGYTFVDPTTHERSLETMPALVQGATALVLKPGFPKLIRMPVSESKQHQDITKIHLSPTQMFIEAELTGILAGPARQKEDLEKGIRSWLNGAMDGGLMADSEVSIEKTDLGPQIFLRIVVSFPQGRRPMVLRPMHLLNASCSQFPDSNKGLHGDLLSARTRSLEINLSSGGQFPSARSASGGALHYNVPDTIALQLSVSDTRTRAKFEVGKGPKGDLLVPPSQLSDVHAICGSLVDLQTLTLRPRWSE